MLILNSLVFSILLFSLITFPKYSTTIHPPKSSSDLKKSRKLGEKPINPVTLSVVQLPSVEITISSFAKLALCLQWRNILYVALYLKHVLKSINFGFNPRSYVYIPLKKTIKRMYFPIDQIDAS